MKPCCKEIKTKHKSHNYEVKLKHWKNRKQSSSCCTKNRNKIFKTSGKCTKISVRTGGVNSLNGLSKRKRSAVFTNCWMASCKGVRVGQDQEKNGRKVRTKEEEMGDGDFLLLLYTRWHY